MTIIPSTPLLSRIRCEKCNQERERGGGEKEKGKRETWEEDDDEFSKTSTTFSTKETRLTRFDNNTIITKVRRGCMIR